jgi:hypothetical protein
MSEIRFKAGHPYTGADGEEALRQRIAAIVSSNPMVCLKEKGYHWQLDNSNNWWMDIDPETKEHILVYRYGTPEKMAALLLVILWLLNLEHFNCPKSTKAKKM